MKDGLTKLSVEVASRLIMHYFKKLGYSRDNTLFTQHRKIGIKRKEVSSLQAIIVTFLIWRVSDRQPRVKEWLIFTYCDRKKFKELNSFIIPCLLKMK